MTGGVGMIGDIYGVTGMRRVRGTARLLSREMRRVFGWPGCFTSPSQWDGMESSCVQFAIGAQEGTGMEPSGEKGTRCTYLKEMSRRRRDGKKCMGAEKSDKNELAEEGAEREICRGSGWIWKST